MKSRSIRRSNQPRTAPSTTSQPALVPAAMMVKPVVAASPFAVVPSGAAPIVLNPWRTAWTV